MTSLATLRRKAVAYAVTRIEAEADYQEIEWELLNLEAYAPLLASFDANLLYEEVFDIIEDAQDTVDDQRALNSERYDAYLAGYPGLDTSLEW
jgi:hypothetical protein